MSSTGSRLRRRPRVPWLTNRRPIWPRRVNARARAAENSYPGPGLRQSFFLAIRRFAACGLGTFAVTWVDVAHDLDQLVRVEACLTRGSARVDRMLLTRFARAQPSRRRLAPAVRGV